MEAELLLQVGNGLGGKIDRHFDRSGDRIGDEHEALAFVGAEPVDVAIDSQIMFRA
jgi:hypothetical protein